MNMKDIQPYLDVVDNLIKKVDSVPEHYIVNEDQRLCYKMALLDVKHELLNLVPVDTK